MDFSYHKEGFIFRVLACIFIKLSTSNYCTHKINTYLQHYPPSPPKGGDGFDHCIIYGVRPARMRSSVPLLEPGPPRFFWWYKNSE
jgi:hypothetical protein